MAIVARAEVWFCTAVLVILVASIPLHPQWLVSDVSWLITVCEKMLEGKQLYIDVLETNPPGAVLIYMLPVVVAHFLEILPETAVVVQTYLGGLLALWIAARALPATLGDGHIGKHYVLLSAALLMFALPLQAFAQREHYAAMLSFPLACAFVRFAEEGVWPGVSVRLSAAILAALMLMIKPIFALPGLLLMIHCWWLSRSLRPIWESGIVLAGLLGAAGTVLSLLVFPAYLTNMLPIITSIYAPYRVIPFYFMFGEPTGAAAVLSAAAAALVIWQTRKMLALTPFLFSAIGFLLGYYIHGKAYPYQAFPAVFYAFLLYLVILISRFPQTFRLDRQKSMGAMGYILVASLSLGLAGGGLSQIPGFMENVGWVAGLNKPTVMSLSPTNHVGFPLVRRIGGDWIDTTSGQWISFYARWCLKHAAKWHPESQVICRQHYANDLKNTVRRLQLQKPDLLLIDTIPLNSWLLPELHSIEPDLLTNYDTIVEDGFVRVMKRR